jgi:hypothetical protein
MLTVLTDFCDISGERRVWRTIQFRCWSTIEQSWKRKSTTERRYNLMTRPYSAAILKTFRKLCLSCTFSPLYFVGQYRIMILFGCPCLLAFAFCLLARKYSMSGNEILPQACNSVVPFTSCEIFTCVGIVQ